MNRVFTHKECVPMPFEEKAEKVVQPIVQNQTKEPVTNIQKA
jgi:hypothetical protein